MLIRNKFKVGQRVYFLHNNLLDSANIEWIVCARNKQVTNIHYILEDSPTFGYRSNQKERTKDETQIFATKEDYKKSI